jgi:hypothetical protein
MLLMLLIHNLKNEYKSRTVLVLYGILFITLPTLFQFEIFD